MPDVSVLRHRGRLAALPVSQVRGVGRQLPEGATQLALWSGEPAPNVQWARCTRGRETVYLACDWARILALPRADVFALSPVLREAVQGAPVVGMGHSRLGTLWLVDLQPEQP